MAILRIKNSTTGEWEEIEAIKGTDKNYLHTQTTASDTWVITHNLNKYPSITVIDSTGAEVIGEIQYDSLNQVTITFAGAFKGFATLN